MISVLIPCRNHAAFLRDCLDSIMAQDSGTAMEVLVVDDGSEEDIETICRSYGKLRYLRQEHLGVSAARNRLIREAAGDYIAFADADDIFVSDKLSQQLRYLQTHPDCPYVGCNVMSFSFAVPAPPYVKNEPAEKFLIPCLIRREVFETVGLFDEDLTRSEDTEFLARCKLMGISGEHYLDEVLYLRRIQEPRCRLPGTEGDLHDIAASIIRARKNAALRQAGSAQVSMVVPCYNAEPYIDEFLQSIKAQTYRPLQLILVDDGSVDSTCSIIESWISPLERAGIDVRFIRCEHRNQSWALNEGLKYCTGKYLSWADSDDILHPSNIEAKAAFLEAHPEIGLVRNGSNRLENGLLRCSPSEESADISDIFEHAFEEKISPVAGCFMMRFSLFLECWSEGAIAVSSLGQNLQLVLPAAGRSLCGYIPEALMTYRIHSDSHSNAGRTTREVLERIEELRRVLKLSAGRSGRDINKYLARADERCDALRRRLVIAIKEYHHLHPQNIVQSAGAEEP